MYTHISMLVPTFEQKIISIFQYQGNHFFKSATIKGNNMLPIGSIFFPLIVAPMRIENNFKGPSKEKPPKLNKPICQSFKIAKC